MINTNYRNNNSPSFAGFKNPITIKKIVLDLDGSYVYGTKEELQNIVEEAQKRSADLIYATGRNKKEVHKLQEKLARQDIILPSPENLISNNGQFIHTNANGVLIPEVEYEEELKRKTNFDSQKVFAVMSGLAKSNKYRFSTAEMQKLKSLEDYSKIKENDPEFHHSKISYYEWNASNFMSEYFVAAGVPLKRLKADIHAALAKFNIKTKFIENQYPKPIMDVCNQNILLQSHPVRRHDDGSMTALFLCPADKADGIEFLRKKSNIPYKEILMAGNDDNDASMALLALKGAYFICLNNASEKLKKISLAIQKNTDRIIMAKHDGAKGILEGISRITG